MIKTLKNLINQFKIKRIKGDYFNLLKERELKAVFSNVPLDAFDNALEIGAGNGYFATLYKKHAKKILCTELSDVIFQAVPTQGITYRQMDAERLIENNCTPERYDLIVANNVLEHIPEIDKTLLDLRKLLADDGVFVIYLPNRLWKFLHIFLYFPERVATLIDSRDFSLRNIKNVFTVDTNGNNLNLKEKNHFTLKNIFIPISPHGANLSHLVEFYKFGKAYWKKKFRNNGFRVVKVKGTTFSTGYMFGYVSFQKVMEKMRIFTETAYVLTKDNAVSLEKAGYFNSNRKECLMKKNIGYKLWKHLNKKYGNTHITPPLSVQKKVNSKNQIFFDNEIIYEGERIFDFSKTEKYFDIRINGTDNKIILNKQYDFSPGKIIIDISGKNHLIKIGKDNQINHNVYIAFVNPSCNISTGSSIIIGERNKFNGDIYISSHSTQDKKVIIGNENLFANGIGFHGNMDHLIFDTNSKEIINNEQDIVLHDRIWIGQEVRFLNKAHVPSNCVIGMRSIVNRYFEEEHCLIAGTPAEIKKRNIMWSEATNDYYLSQLTPLV